MFFKIFKLKKENNKFLDSQVKKKTESNLIDLSYILGNKKEIIKRNLLAGIARGIGVGIGLTVITGMIVILLRKLITLNIPVIGDYIADIVEIVEKSR